MEIATKTAVFSITKEGLLKIRFLPNSLEIDLEEAKAQIDAAEKLTGNQNMYVLVDARQSMHELTNEAKDYIAKHPNKKAEAILVKELHQRIVASFYLKLSSYQNNHPVKVFNDEQAAIGWLLSFRN